MGAGRIGRAIAVGTVGTAGAATGSETITGFGGAATFGRAAREKPGGSGGGKGASGVSPEPVERAPGTWSALVAVWANNVDAAKVPVNPRSMTTTGRPFTDIIRRTSFGRYLRNAQLTRKSLGSSLFQFGSFGGVFDHPAFGF